MVAECILQRIKINYVLLLWIGNLLDDFKHSFYIWQKMHRNILIESLLFNDLFIISTYDSIFRKRLFSFSFQSYLCVNCLVQLMVEEDCCNDHNFLKSLTFGLTIRASPLTSQYSVVSFSIFKPALSRLLYEVLSKFWTWSVFTIKLILTTIKCNKVT